MTLKWSGRDKERLMCSSGPPSRSILDGPGGEPDGAELGWGVQGVGGRYKLQPESVVLEKSIRNQLFVRYVGAYVRIH